MDIQKLLRNLRTGSLKVLTLKTNMEFLKPEIRRQKFEAFGSTSCLQSQVAGTTYIYLHEKYRSATIYLNQHIKSFIVTSLHNITFGTDIFSLTNSLSPWRMGFVIGSPNVCCPGWISSVNQSDTVSLLFMKKNCMKISLGVCRLDRSVTAMCLYKVAFFLQHWRHTVFILL
jgi:hypothetical protein